jgi:hypothetical protein
MFAKGSNTNPIDESQSKKAESPPTTTQPGLMFKGLEVKGKKPETPVKKPSIKSNEGVLPAPSKGSSGHIEDSYLPPKLFFKEPDTNPKIEDTIKTPEDKEKVGKGGLKSEKSLVTKGSNEGLMQYQKKEKDIESAFIKNLQNEPLKANEILTKELESYYRQYINFQLEEQSLLIKKKKLQQDIERQYTEIESKTKELEELTNKEEYKEAELLDLKLKGVKDFVLF